MSEEVDCQVYIFINARRNLFSEALSQSAGPPLHPTDVAHHTQHHGKLPSSTPQRNQAVLSEPSPDVRGNKTSIIQLKQRKYRKAVQGINGGEGGQSAIIGCASLL
jgi:hypothetical protein